MLKSYYVSLLPSIRRWVFKDYFSRHSDLCQKSVSRADVGMEASFHACIGQHMLTVIIFKNPPRDI